MMIMMMVDDDDDDDYDDDDDADDDDDVVWASAQRYEIHACLRLDLRSDNGQENSSNSKSAPCKNKFSPGLENLKR